MRRLKLDRRKLLLGSSAATVGLTLSGCEKLTQSVQESDILDTGESLTRRIQGLITGTGALAMEYPASAISPDFKANGTTRPDNDDYLRHAANGFADWKLEIGGLVKRPLSLSLADLRATAAREQITRHDCVEGWSGIAGWKGARLGALLDRAGLLPEARYIAFFCADTLELTLDGTGDYYETIAIVDAYHPQTILAYEMNGGPVSVLHGAPLRLRCENELGFKMVKWIAAIEFVRDFADLGAGEGGYNEDHEFYGYRMPI